MKMIKVMDNKIERDNAQKIRFYLVSLMLKYSIKNLMSG